MSINKDYYEEHAFDKDFVRVVRCKNCDKYYICPYISIHSKEGGYCSLGKRKGEEYGGCGAEMEGKK